MIVGICDDEEQMRDKIEKLCRKNYNIQNVHYEQFADAVQRLKRDLHLRTNLTDLHINEEKKEELIRLSHHANLKNNPVEVTDEDLRRLYDGLCD